MVCHVSRSWQALGDLFRASINDGRPQLTMGDDLLVTRETVIEALGRRRAWNMRRDRLTHWSWMMIDWFGTLVRDNGNITEEHNA